jgi:hypothetical protein
VRLNDEGYSKSIYVNSFVPKFKGRDRFFYLETHDREAWILLLVKALAKYAGSYHALSTFTFERLCSILFGSQPTQLVSATFAKIYEKKYPEYSRKFLEHNMNSNNRDHVELYAFI